LIGLSDTAIIDWNADLRPATNRGRGMGIAWPHRGDGHNVRAWAELLVAVRALSPATMFPPALALGVQRRGQRIGLLWSETLRYRMNYAYLHEVQQTREAAEWLLVNSDIL
jgi:hypothetical protein